MKVLLTGSSGWLGQHLAPMLRTAGHNVIGLDVAPGADTQILATVADRSAVRRAFADHRPDAVIHGGALHKPDMARFCAQSFIDANVTGTLNLLEAACAAGHDRFVFTSTTSLMASQAVHREVGEETIWMDEDFGPIEPRNIYGITKLAAEQLCRRAHADQGLSCVILRTSRFFRADDDPLAVPSGDNLKANELLSRRLAVEDAARAHLLALERAPALGFGLYLVSAPTPFDRREAADLKADAASVIARHFPQAAALYAKRGWVLPSTIGRIYDSRRSVAALGLHYAWDFARLLDALECDSDLPFGEAGAKRAATARRAS